MLTILFVELESPFFHLHNRGVGFYIALYRIHDSAPTGPSGLRCG